MKKIMICVLVVSVLLSSIFITHAAEVDIADTDHSQYCIGPTNTDEYQWRSTNYSFPCVKFGSTGYVDGSVIKYIGWKVQGTENWYRNISKFRVFWKTEKSSWRKYKDISYNSYTYNHRDWNDVPVKLYASDFSSCSGVWSDSYIKVFFTVRAMDQRGNYISDYSKNTYSSLVYGDWIAPKLEPYKINGSSHKWKVTFNGLKTYNNACKIRFFYRNKNGNWVTLQDRVLDSFGPTYITINADKISYKAPNGLHYNITCRLVDVQGNYCSAFLYDAIGNKSRNRSYWIAEC